MCTWQSELHLTVRQSSAGPDEAVVAASKVSQKANSFKRT